MDDDDWIKKAGSSSGGGYKPLQEIELPKPKPKEETIQERAAQQRQKRRSELTYSEDDYARWTRNRRRVENDKAKALAESPIPVKLPKFDLDEVLDKPELGAIAPVNIDPASMFADDIEELAREGKEFLKTPTLAGAASMAVIAIPGKAADETIDAIKAISKKERLKLNKIKGDAFEKETLKELEKTQSGIVSQVTVKTQSGTRTRIDLLGFDDNGVIKCTECKASANAPLTRNQKKAFPEMESSGGVVVGKGKDGFEGGTIIPPTKIDIIRPKE